MERVSTDETGLDSRFRENDKKEDGNDKGKCGNDKGGLGN